MTREIDEARVAGQVQLEQRISTALRNAGIPPDLNTVAALLLIADKLQRALGLDRESWQKLLDVTASDDLDEEEGRAGLK